MRRLVPPAFVRTMPPDLRRSLRQTPIFISCLAPLGVQELVRSMRTVVRVAGGSRGLPSAAQLTDFDRWVSGAAACARRGVGDTHTTHTQTTVKPGTADFNTAAFEALAAVFAANSTRESAVFPLARVDGWEELIPSPAGAEAWQGVLAAAKGPKKGRSAALVGAFEDLLEASKTLSTAASRPLQWQHAAHFEFPTSIASRMTIEMEALLAGPPARVAWYDLTLVREGGRVKGGPFVMKAGATGCQIVLFGQTNELADRHIDPPVIDMTDVRTAISELDLRSKGEACRRVLVLWGPSGAGKTVAAVATALELKAPFAVYLLPVDVPEAECSDTPLKDTRDDRACKYILSRLQGSINSDWLKRPPATAAPKPFVLILDEFGAYPGFISAVLSARLEITAAIRQHLQVDSRTPVYIIVAGTGVEGASLQPGSHGTSYLLRRVEPPLFADFKPYMPEVMYTFVTERASPLARRLHQLVTNARCAAAFATTALKSLKLTNPAHWDTLVATEGLMRAMGLLTTTEYVSLNGLSDMSHPQLNHAILRSMGTLFSVETLPKDVVKLKTIAGLVGDRGVPDREPPHAVQAPNNEPRYEVASAFEAMLQIIFGLGDRPSSAEGFEQALADFLAVAIQMSSLSEFTADDVAAMMAHCKTEPPRGWSAPLSVVPWLREIGCVDDKRAFPPSVSVRQAHAKLEGGENFEKLSLIAGFSNTDANGDSHADVVVNSGKAAFADVIVWHNDAVLLCQAKRYTSAKLTFGDIVQELYKMGCRDLSVVAARWAATADVATMKAKAPSLGLSAKLRKKVNEATNAPHVPMSRELIAKLKVLPDAKQFVEKQFGVDVLLPCEKTAEALAAVAKKRGAPQVVKVHYVIAVIGNATKLSDAETDVLRRLGTVKSGGMVRLLYAPVPKTPQDEGAADTAEARIKANKESRRTRLAGYYPIGVAAKEPAELAAIPAPEPTR